MIYSDTTFWIARDEAGVVRGGVIDPRDANAWTVVLANDGWQRAAGCSDPIFSPDIVDPADPAAHADEAREALSELAWNLGKLGLLGPAAAAHVHGPWRLEMTHGALMG